MTTDDLISTLSGDVVPVSANAVERRVIAGIAMGAGGSLVLMSAWLGFRSDWAEAMLTGAFWMKWAYTISLGVLALAVTAHIARPDAPVLKRIWILAAPVAALALFAGWELATTPLAGWKAMWLGVSWQECSLHVAMLAGPVFAGMLWSLRQLAPTNLVAAGAAAGLASGAFAATVYCLHCPEVSATFIITWYSLGIVAASAFGALVGPKLLRW